jgi:hypothetical protein
MAHTQTRAAVMTWSRRHLSISLAAVLGVVVTAVVYYPAVMSPDSLGMYREAITGTIQGDRKQPLTAFLWMLILQLWHHPLALLLFQNAVFWVGLSLIAYSTRLTTRTATLGVLAIGFLPPVFALLGTLWSDVLLAAALTLCVGLVVSAKRRGSRVLLLTAATALGAGVATRSNALPAILPLAMWIAAAWYQDEPPARRWKQYLTALALVGVLWGSTRLFAALVAESSGAGKRSLQFALLHDLAGIAVHTGDLRLPAHVHRALPGFTLDSLRPVYDPADVNLFVYNPKWKIEMFITSVPSEFDDLVETWKAAVRAHPGAYLRRRAEAFGTILQLKGQYYLYHTGINSNDLGLFFPDRPIYRAVMRWLDATRFGFFRGWLFASLALGVLLIAWRARRWDAVAVAASGLLYIAPYVLITTGSDFRYIWWMVVASLISLLLLSDRRPVAPVEITPGSYAASLVSEPRPPS